MQKVKTLSNIYVRPEPLMRETSTFLNLHIVASQMERLNNNKAECLNKIEQINKRLERLGKRYNSLKKAIE